MLTEVASGHTDDGRAWVIEAGGSSSECWTFMRIRRPDGRWTPGGGLGGVAIGAGRSMNLSTHREDDDLAYVVGRVHPRVSLVRLRLATGEVLDVRPSGVAPDLGVRFVGLVLPERAVVTAAEALDDSGRMLEHHGQRQPPPWPKEHPG
jgi:hypothetical protein